MHILQYTFPSPYLYNGMALTSTGRKIEHNKVVVDTQTYESNCLIISVNLLSCGQNADKGQYYVTDSSYCPFIYICNEELAILVVLVMESNKYTAKLLAVLCFLEQVLTIGFKCVLKGLTNVF